MRLLKIPKRGNEERLRKKIWVLGILVILFIINLVWYFFQSEQERREYEKYKNITTYVSQEAADTKGVLGASPNKMHAGRNFVRQNAYLAQEFPRL